MSRSRRAGVILVVAAAALAVAPIDALAQRMGGGARSGSHGGSHRGFHHGGPGGRSFAHRPFGGGFIVFAPPLWYGSDLSDDPGPTYAPAPAYDPAVYGPGVGGTLALAPPAPPTPSVIQYPTWSLGAARRRADDSVSLGCGSRTRPRRRLRPPRRAANRFTPAPLESGRPEPPGNTKIYRWTDGQGVLHLTDRLDTVSGALPGAGAGEPLVLEPPAGRELTAELAAVAGAKPEPHQMAAQLGLVLVLVGGATVDDHAVVQHLDLTTLEP